MVKTVSLSTIRPILAAPVLVIPSDDISKDTSTVPISFVFCILQILSSLETGHVDGRFVVVCERGPPSFHHKRKSALSWLEAFHIRTIASEFSDFD